MRPRTAVPPEREERFGQLAGLIAAPDSLEHTRAEGQSREQSLRVVRAAGEVESPP